VDASAPPRRLRVNDLYTAEVSDLLGQRLRATTVVNRGLDRNHIDLNRVSAVSRQAPWFGELLVEVLETALARHDHVEVVFVHGWHTGQPRCDIGIGAIEENGHLRLPVGAGLTLGETCLRQRVRGLQAACMARGIAASVGERYPASHRNNVLQMFSERGRERSDHWARKIAHWSGRGRLSALQLELGAPLRWPGVWRDRFVDAFLEAFDASNLREATTVRERSATHERVATLSCVDRQGETVSALDLQFYDPGQDLGALAGIGPAETGRLAGRLLFFAGGKRVALFTGEGRSGNGLQVPPLRATLKAGEVRWSFAGPVLSVEDAALYVDLEAALAASRVQSAELEATFLPIHKACAETGAQFGRVEATCRLGGETRFVKGSAFAGVRALPSSTAGYATVCIDLGGDAIVARGSDTGDKTTAVEFVTGEARSLPGVRLVVSRGVDRDPRQLTLHRQGAAPVHGEPVSMMTILRPAGADAYLRVCFGVARFRCGGRSATGFYNVGTLVPAQPQAGP
jgi:hypothetical protein